MKELSADQLEKCLVYLQHVVTHKKHVLDAMHKMARYYLMKSQLLKALQIMERASMHDISKFYEDEFIGYTEGIELSSNGKWRFDTHLALPSVELHRKRNPHHFEFWTESNGFHPSQMDDLSIIEMCCDWYAMSVQFGNSVHEWFSRQTDMQEKMPKEVLDRVEYYLGILEYTDI